jgi:MFS family permease
MHRTPLLSLQMVFALNALGLAVWFPRIPDVKAALGLDVLTLSFALFGLPAGTMLGFLTAGRVTYALGLRRSCLIAGAGFLLAFILPALAWDAWSLGLALFVSGATVALIEVAMNAKASQMEQETGRRLMTRCHAFWSFGTVGGALIGGAFAQAGVGFLAQQLVVEPVFAALTIVFARGLVADPPRAAGREGPGYALPSAALLLLCLVPIGALLVEGAMMEWSALLLREHIGASPFWTAVTFAVFALTMGVMRFFGDRLAEALGPRPVILASSLAMGIGIAGFGLSPGLWASLPLAALVGAGCANVYPLVMSLAGQAPGRRPEQNVATLALIAFTAFLIGPPAIGTMASVLGLPAALALLAPLGLVPVAILGGRGPVGRPVVSRSRPG